MFLEQGTALDVPNAGLGAAHVDDICVGRGAVSQKDYAQRPEDGENEHDDSWRKAPLRRW